jgi:hypothetical protein
MTSLVESNENLDLIKEINENKEPGKSLKIVRQWLRMTPKRDDFFKSFPTPRSPFSSQSLMEIRF